MREFNDSAKEHFVDAIVGMLKIQLTVAVGIGIEDAHGEINRQALGYIYGFIDAALRAIGQDMADTSIGVPITFQVLSHLFPGREAAYVQYLADNISSNQAIMLGAVTGGQQYLDFNNGKLSAPMGLARAILDHRS